MKERCGTCTHCDGSGQEKPDCNRCNGNGWVYDPSGGTMTCPDCDDERCSVCNGDKEIEQPEPEEIVENISIDDETVT